MQLWAPQKLAEGRKGISRLKGTKTDAISSNMRFSGTRGREANQVEVKIEVGGETLGTDAKVYGDLTLTNQP